MPGYQRRHETAALLFQVNTVFEKFPRLETVVIEVACPLRADIDQLASILLSEETHEIGGVVVAPVTLFVLIGIAIGELGDVMGIDEYLGGRVPPDVRDDTLQLTAFFAAVHVKHHEVGIERIEVVHRSPDERGSGKSADCAVFVSNIGIREPALQVFDQHLCPVLRDNGLSPEEDIDRVTT